VGALSLSVLLCLVVIVSIVGSDRTVIVPPNIDRTFWVTKEKASREYLEEMASYVAWLVLDVTPTTVDWKKNVLLNWVAPDQHAAMKTKMDIEAERLRSNNAATFFLVQQLAADEAKQSVVVTGRLRRQINGADVTDRRMYVRVRCESVSALAPELLREAYPEVAGLLRRFYAG